MTYQFGYLTPPSCPDLFGKPSPTCPETSWKGRECDWDMLWELLTESYWTETSTYDGSQKLLSANCSSRYFGIEKGVGSVLGGGNFWMGAASGLIVTGFNHVVHKMKADDYEAKVDKELAESDIDTSNPPARDFDSLDQVEKLPTIAKIITKVNAKGGFQRCIDTTIPVKKDPVTGEIIEGTAGYVPDGTSEVHMTPAAFLSWKDLAATYYHELGHVYINYYFRTQYPKGLNDGGRKNIDEYLAYNMEYRYSNSGWANTQSKKFYDQIKIKNYQSTARNINLQIIRNGF